jgi:thiamine-phosphate pyrophosphorylase
MIFPRVYPILDTQSITARAYDAKTVARAWLEGGARILQYRHKAAWTRAIFDEAEQIAADCREHAAVFVVNDRADMAGLIGGGLHVGQDDLAPGDARGLLGPAAFLGYSTHNPDQLDAAAVQPVNYVAIGPVFATASKHKPDPIIGLDDLKNWRRRCGHPVVAIGGITRETARAVFAAGADSIAVIGDLLPENCTTANLRQRMEEWQQLAQM